MSTNSLAREWRAFLAAMQFLTVLPFSPKTVFNESDYALSLAWYPAAGLIISLLFLSPLFFLSTAINPQFTAALILAIWVVATGALHLDGLADCSDAWVGGLGDREKTLQILKDPRAGPMAVVALVIVLLLKWSAIAALIEESHWELLALIPIMSRSSLIVAFQNFTYVSQQGLGSALKLGDERVSLRLIVSHVITGTLIVGAGLFQSLPMFLLLVWLLVGLVIYFSWRHACASKLGGFNGDCAGALLEILETGWLISAVVCVC